MTESANNSKTVSHLDCKPNCIHNFAAICKPSKLDVICFL